MKWSNWQVCTTVLLYVIKDRCYDAIHTIEHIERNKAPCGAAGHWLLRFGLVGKQVEIGERGEFETGDEY